MTELSRDTGIENIAGSGTPGPDALAAGSEISTGTNVTGRADGRTVEPGYYAKLARLGLSETYGGDLLYRDETGQLVKAMPGKWD